MQAVLPGSKPNCITFKDGRIHHIPIVYLDFVFPSASSVCVDNDAIGKCAAKVNMPEQVAIIGVDNENDITDNQRYRDAVRLALTNRPEDS